MVYFVYPSYEPNTAAFNRALAYLKAIDELKVAITVVFFLPNENRNKIEFNFKYVIVEYVWDGFFVDTKILRYLFYFYYLLRFRMRLKAGDKVYIYSANDILKYIISQKSIDVFFEITEHPEVHMLYSRLYKPTVIQHLDLCKRVKGLFVISTGLRDYYIQNGVRPDSIHVINIIVDPSRFDNIEEGDYSHENYIAYCGTASNNKDGVDQLIKAFAIVTDKHSDYKLYIIGSTPSRDQKIGNYKLVEELKVEDGVVFTGMKSSNEIPRLLKNAEILALDRPNNIQAKYGFPTKLGEYLLTGNPVVVTNVGDIPLFLQDGVSALIAEPQNPQSFANKLCWAIDHPKEAKVIGEEGKRVAMRCFNNITETKKLLSVIN